MKARRLGSAGLTTTEFLILTVVMGVFMSAAMNEVMSSLGAGALTASPFFLLAAIGEKRKWPGLPAVCVVLGVLAGGVVSARLIAKVAADPKSHHARLLRRGHEGATLGKLMDLRGAVKTYQVGHGGRPPADLASAAVPAAKLPPHHSDSAAVRLAPAPDDAGGWLYDAPSGKVRVNCTHTDTKGSVWTAY